VRNRYDICYIGKSTHAQLWPWQEVTISNPAFGGGVAIQIENYVGVIKLVGRYDSLSFDAIA